MSKWRIVVEYREDGHIRSDIYRGNKEVYVKPGVILPEKVKKILSRDRDSFRYNPKQGRIESVIHINKWE